MGIYDGMEKLERLRKTASAGVVLICIGLVGFIYLVLLYKTTMLPFIGIGLIVAGVFCIKGKNEQYRKIYKEVIVEKPLRDNFSDVYYAWRNGFTLNEVNNFMLLKHGEVVTSEDYLRAKYKGVPFEMADVWLKDRVSQNNTSRDGTIFLGRIIVFELSNKDVISTRVYSRHFYGRRKDYCTADSKVEMESIDFNETFDTFSASPHNAFYLLTPQFMERLICLSSNHDDIAMHVFGNKVIFAYRSRMKNAFDNVSWLVKTSYPDEVEKVKGDIDDIKSIIDAVCALNMGE